MRFRTYIDDCDAGATQAGLDLLNAFGQCIDDNCYGMGAAAHNADAGKPYCAGPSLTPQPAPPLPQFADRFARADGPGLGGGWEAEALPVAIDLQLTKSS